MPWLEPVTLRGDHAALKPLSLDHAAALTAAALAARASFLKRRVLIMLP